MVTLALHLIGVMDFQGRHGCSGGHLGPCSDGAWIGASLGTRVGLARGAGAGNNCTILSGKVARELLYPSLPSVLLNLLSWSGGKLQASLREKGVAFQATVISDVSRLHRRTACLLHARTLAQRCLNQAHIQSGAKAYPLNIYCELKLFILHC